MAGYWPCSFLCFCPGQQKCKKITRPTSSYLDRKNLHNKEFIFLAEPMWGIPRRQDGPAQVANENTGFALPYLLTDSAIKYRVILHTSTLFSQFLIFLFRDCTTVMKPTASDVEAPSIVCCSISVRAWEGIKTSYKYSLSHFNKSEKDIVHLK